LEVPTVKSEVTVPLAGGVTGFGLKLAVAPVVGKPEVTARLTAELNPLIEVMVITEV